MYTGTLIESLMSLVGRISGTKKPETAEPMPWCEAWGAHHEKGDPTCITTKHKSEN